MMVMKNKIKRPLSFLGISTLLISCMGQALAAEFIGPLMVTATTGEPFRGTNSQPVPGPGLPPPALVPFDFVEEEYFISGIALGKSYKTSVLVRRPRDPENFSGLVAVETVHLAGAIPFWGTGKVWLQGNHGWVGVASQLPALEAHVKKANIDRYATLHIPDVSQPGDRPGREGEQDTMSQAIMTQVGELLKRNPDDGPFHGMSVKHLLMGGASQTGGTTLRYIAQAHDEARMPDGRPIFDGYAPWEAFPAEPVFAENSVTVHLVTEGDLINYMWRGRPMSWGEDREGENGGYRHYQVTGASHVGTRGSAAEALRAYGTLDGIGSEAQLSAFPHAELLNPAHQLLVNWVLDGEAPRREKPIAVSDGKVIRDQNGIAKGGVRSPYVDLPTARYIASVPPNGTLFGLEEAFNVEKLRELYGTREIYLRQFNAQIEELVAAGWLYQDDAKQLMEQEAARPPF